MLHSRYESLKTLSLEQLKEIWERLHAKQYKPRNDVYNALYERCDRMKDKIALVESNKRMIEMLEKNNDK